MMHKTDKTDATDGVKDAVDLVCELRRERWMRRAAEAREAHARYELAHARLGRAKVAERLAMDVARGVTLWNMDEVFFLLHGRNRHEGEEVSQAVWGVEKGGS
ncbi:MAG: hypothetical protein RBU21_05960 [FCB group bacterium]|jgi:hypothetical protein|nr:hypothetical protein [FCB group bacterium]